MSVNERERENRGVVGYTSILGRAEKLVSSDLTQRPKWRLFTQARGCLLSVPSWKAHIYTKSLSYIISDAETPVLIQSSFVAAHSF